MEEDRRTKTTLVYNFYSSCHEQFSTDKDVQTKVQVRDTLDEGVAKDEGTRQKTQKGTTEVSLRGAAWSGQPGDPWYPVLFARV